MHIYLFIFVRQTEVTSYVIFHPTQQEGIYGVTQHGGTLEGRLNLK